MVRCEQRINFPFNFINSAKIPLFCCDPPLLSSMVRSHLICLIRAVFCRLISARGRLSPSVCPRLRLSTTATVRTAGTDRSWHRPEPGGRCCSTQRWQQRPGRHVSLSQKLSGGERSWCEIHCSCYSIHCRWLYCCTGVWCLYQYNNIFIVINRCYTRQ